MAGGLLPPALSNRESEYATLMVLYASHSLPSLKKTQPGIRLMTQSAISKNYKLGFSVRALQYSSQVDGARYLDLTGSNGCLQHPCMRRSFLVYLYYCFFGWPCDCYYSYAVSSVVFAGLV